MKTNPKFIVFEGIDGAGKTTQINLLRETLEKRGFTCYVTAEPTDMPSGKAIRRALAKEVDSTPIQMAEMFAHDRELHNTDAQSGIERMLADGITVICDRYYYSSMAYQGSFTDMKWVARMNLDCPEIRRPDVCIFLDLLPEQSLERISNSERAFTEIYETKEKLSAIRDSFYRAFDMVKDTDNVVKINAYDTVEAVADEIYAEVAKI
jgi:dTMP kinase